MLNRSKYILIGALFLVIGIIIGGYLFSNTQPRSVIALNECKTRCYKANELAGLIASVGLNAFGTAILPTVFETDKIIVVKHPDPNTTFHEVILPKKDIRDISEVATDDIPYVEEVFAYVSKVVKEKNLQKYRVVTNGPGYQSLAYLHFHLIGSLPK